MINRPTAMARAFGPLQKPVTISTRSSPQMRAAFKNPAMQKMASSKESMGDVGLRQFAKRMIQRGFRDVEGTEAVGFSHGQFGLVVEALDHTARLLLSGAEVVQDQRAVRAWQHHSSGNFPAQLGEA